MTLLASLQQPADLRGLTSVELTALAAEIRQSLVESVSKTGGHLGPNLGVVELTIALHRVFDSPHDSIIFDTGHQAYVHKLLTGRQDFSQLRRAGGLSGYPARDESPHDIVENSHASASLSWAHGVALGYSRSGQPDRHTVAVIGDGALTGGMAWEALNNIADHPDLPLVIVVNDNGRSYAPTIGGLAHHLDALRTNPHYEHLLDWGKRTLHAVGAPGRVAYDALHGLKKGMKDMLVPGALFEGLGIKYTGPVDGHDITALEFTLARAKEYRRPVIVHVITEKGRGYTPAEEDVADRFHAVGVIHPETGLPVTPSRFGWTSVFAEEIVEIARADERVVGLTAAMLAPVGLAPFAAEFPTRVIDVGIAEQHGVTAAAGLAFTGQKPVFALYATFLNRGIDQLIMDAALHRAGIVFSLDRAGVTGDDGASHNGIWDIALLRGVPGVHIYAPRDENSLRQALRRAVARTDGPSVVRYPKGELPPNLAAVRHDGSFEVLYEQRGAGLRLLIVAMGPLTHYAVAAAQQLAEEGVAVTVVDPVRLAPLADDLRQFAAQFPAVITVEDGLVEGGAGQALASALAGGPTRPQVTCVGVRPGFLAHDTRAAILARMGMDTAGLVRTARAMQQAATGT
ncbi:1-deoxy-D-xylulose-5-phosphate synthase [Buchananella hordeovulneris]|uniref:1-deoxy-D-xylulose-5-phosphate synthase n=1 Tax=Buchananella hordeovulneris TaxID=52770 RepID=A0A1Q5PY65_9ACTO|nr:1-deoxy-D-xylulose-5-phosphate synthase [Buchananella hordeovulneris]OKL52477.1 1-deoxy-D-xylulose-5-phosphate synthase [Buchananella hordeovulneris]RRD45331.1 1-deoxy-D-xylulose-5-phosphate synthase [Buchananella hordeovulneris]